MPLNHLSNLNSPYKYWFSGFLYKSGKLNKSKKFENFFDELCQNIFDINLTMLEGVEEFPLVYSERKSYSSIAAAINAITPYHISEYTRNCGGCGILDESGKERKTRTVDFWCSSKDKSFDVWIETKALRFYVSKKAKNQIDKNTKELIQEAFKQILELNKIDKKRKYQSHKLILLNTKVICNEGDFDELYSLGELDKIPQIFADELNKEYTKIDGGKIKNLSKGLLLGILDLRECIQKDRNKDIIHRVDYKNGYENYDFFDKYIAPYIILAGIVVE